MYCYITVQAYFKAVIREDYLCSRQHHFKFVYGLWYTYYLQNLVFAISVSISTAVEGKYLFWVLTITKTW